MAIKTVLPFEEANRVFKKLKILESFAHEYVQDGCYARAHLGCLLFEDLSPQKAWAFQGDQRLSVNTNNGKTTWCFHVAPVFAVEDESHRALNMVFDPSLFDRPVFLGEWGKKINAQSQNLQIKPFGTSPNGIDGDYYPGVATNFMTDGRALKVLEEYNSFLKDGVRAAFMDPSHLDSVGDVAVQADEGELSSSGLIIPKATILLPD